MLDDAGCAAAPLETERLLLRAPNLADAPAIAALLEDGRVARTTANIPHPYGQADAEALLSSRSADDADQVWMITARDDGALIGAIGYRPRSEGDEAELGYWLAEPLWRRGLMSEAVERVVRHLFEDLGLAAVAANAMPANVGSWRIMDKVGMTRVGEGSIPAPARGQDMHVVHYRLTRAEWLAAHTLPVVLVVAVALIDADGRVLLARRPEGKAMAGLWEFPGGKVAPGETPEAALIRELKEELGLDTRQSCLAPIAFASHRYADFHLLMPLYVCRVWDGTPTPHEGQELAWVRPARLGNYAMPPADAPLVAQLRDLL